MCDSNLQTRAFNQQASPEDRSPGYAWENQTLGQRKSPSNDPLISRSLNVIYRSLLSGKIPV